MNLEIVNQIRLKLNEAEGIKSCTVKITPDAWLMALMITNINNTKLQLITHDDSYGFFNSFEDGFNRQDKETLQFLMQTNLKLKDIEIIHDVFEIMRDCITEEKISSEFNYSKERNE